MLSEGQYVFPRDATQSEGEAELAELVTVT